MAIVKKIDKRIKVSVNDAIKYQILTHCFFNDIQISNSDLKCLAYLAKSGREELTSFCKNITDAGIFKSPQSARNAITKAEKKKLLYKTEDKYKKTIGIHKDLNIQTDDVVLLDFKILGYESKES